MHHNHFEFLTIGIVWGENGNWCSTNNIIRILLTMKSFWACVLFLYGCHIHNEYASSFHSNLYRNMCRNYFHNCDSFPFREDSKGGVQIKFQYQGFRSGSESIESHVLEGFPQAELPKMLNASLTVQGLYLEIP